MTKDEALSAKHEGATTVALKLALEALGHFEKAGLATLKTIDAIIAVRECLAQQNQFNPDWDAMAVMVEEQQRMAKRIAELEAQPDVDRRSTESKETFDQQEPVAHSVISGALFDFMGWLTSRKERIVLSSADNASPAVEAITEFAKMRNLSLDDAKVQDWNTTPPHRKPLMDEEIDKLPWEPHEGNPMTFAEGLRYFARAIEAAHGIKE